MCRYSRAIWLITLLLLNYNTAGQMSGYFSSHQDSRLEDCQLYHCYRGHSPNNIAINPASNQYFNVLIPSIRIRIEMVHLVLRLVRNSPVGGWYSKQNLLIQQRYQSSRNNNSHPSLGNKPLTVCNVIIVPA